jgi:hypothetical protein
MLLPARSVTRVVDEFTKVCEIVKDITARHASDPSKYNEGEIIDSSHVTITQDGKYTLVITVSGSSKEQREEIDKLLG